MSKRCSSRKAGVIVAALLTALGSLISCAPTTGEVAEAGPGCSVLVGLMNKLTES